MKYLKYILVILIMILIISHLRYEKIYDKKSNIIETSIMDDTDQMPIEEKKEEVVEETVEKPASTKSNTKPEVPTTSLPKEETPKVEEKEQEKELINNDENVIDTDHFMYSIHKGKIEYSSMSACVSRGEEIALSNTIDILYFNCTDVRSKANTILGYYLDIVCESGNCDKYK